MSQEKIVDALLDKDEIPDDPRTELLNQIKEYEDEVADVQTGISQVKMAGNPVTCVDLFSELQDLSVRATAVLDECKADIERSSIIDAELIASYAILIKATRDIVSDYLGIYKMQLSYEQKVDMEGIKQKNKKELMRMKYNLDNTDEAEYEVQKAYIQEVVVDLLNTKDKKSAEQDS